MTSAIFVKKKRGDFFFWSIYRILPLLTKRYKSSKRSWEKGRKNLLWDALCSFSVTCQTEEVDVPPYNKAEYNVWGVYFTLFILFISCSAFVPVVHPGFKPRWKREATSVAICELFSMQPCLQNPVSLMPPSGMVIKWTNSVCVVEDTWHTLWHFMWLTF